MPAAPKDHKDGTFSWTSPKGVEITLPSISSIPAGVLRKNRKLDEMDFLFTTLEDVIDADELGKVDALPQGDLNALFTEWQEFEGTSFPQS